MVKNTQQNREQLAKEAVIQMPMKELVDIVASDRCTYYEMLSDEDFNDEWQQVFSGTKYLGVVK